MALGGVFMSDTDGNIGTSSTTSTEKVTGLLFDISKQAKFFEEGAGLAVKDKLQGNVIEINSMDDLKELGITAYSGDTEKDLLFGIPYYQSFLWNTRKHRTFVYHVCRLWYRLECYRTNATCSTWYD